MKGRLLLTSADFNSSDVAYLRSMRRQPMALVEKSVLVSYPAERMFELVDQVERYPEFLPWCGGTHVEAREAGVTRASILIDYHGIKQSFKTENRTHPPERIEIQLISGPFRQLDGLWRFTAL